MRGLLLLAGLAACHQNCGDNGGEVYARFLDPTADCWSIRQSTDSEKDDWALCKVGSEEWLCQLGTCRVVGPTVLVRRVQ